MSNQPPKLDNQPAGRATVSASVVTFKSDVEHFDRLIASLIPELLAATGPGGSAELYLVCNDGNVELAERVRKRLQTEDPSGYIGFLCLGDQGNIGYGAAHNLAIARATSQFHLILNPDVEMSPGSLLAARRFLEENPEYVLAAPRAYGELGRYQHLAKRYPSVAVLFARATKLGSNRFFRSYVREYTYADKLPSDEPTQIELASGCCMFCRTGALKAVRGFDQSYFLYFEDYDLSMRLRNEGRLAELPDFQIKHFGGWATRRQLRRMTHFGISMIRFFSRHGWRVL